MNFHGTLADLQFDGNDLVRLPGNHPIHDFMFPGRQAFYAAQDFLLLTESFALLLVLFQGGFDFLEQGLFTIGFLNEIDRARIVSDRSMRAAFVRMGSTVTYVVDGNPGRTVTLVYPADADIEDGRISITTPVGTALIGLKAGQSISFLTGNGRAHDLTVIEVTQNPEGYQDR